MKLKILLTTMVLLAAAIQPISSDAQRRSRPGSMKHSKGEVESVMKETSVNATYIKNNTYFEGPSYYTDGYGAAGIKIGTCGLLFKNGRYFFSFDAAKFQTRTAMSKKERQSKGISDHQYDQMWSSEKISDDVEHSGRYKVVKQYGKILLILYDGNSDDIVAKITLSSLNTKTIEWTEDNILIQLSLKR